MGTVAYVSVKHGKSSQTRTWCKRNHW